MESIDFFVTTGGGPAECRIALKKFLGILETNATGADCSCEQEIVFEGDKHGPKSVLLKIEGPNANEFVRKYEGTHKFIFPSPVRKNHPRKNWFLSGSRVELPDATVSEPRAQDMTFETFQAGGPGGQHQNKTDSAVRLRHLPTGITVVSRNERSQHQNKRMAIQMLLKILTMEAESREKEAGRSVFEMNKAIERGNATETWRLYM